MQGWPSSSILSSSSSHVGGFPDSLGLSSEAPTTQSFLPQQPAPASIPQLSAKMPIQHGNHMTTQCPSTIVCILKW